MFDIELLTLILFDFMVHQIISYVLQLYWNGKYGLVLVNCLNQTTKLDDWLIRKFLTKRKHQRQKSLFNNISFRGENWEYK